MNMAGVIVERRIAGKPVAPASGSLRKGKKNEEGP